MLVVLLKGALAGLAAALVFRLFERKNPYLAVIAAAAVCPVVNTGIFLLGCIVFFFDAVGSMANAADALVFVYLITVFVGRNFVFELALNLILSPALLRIVEIGKKSFGRK